MRLPPSLVRALLQACLALAFVLVAVSTRVVVSARRELQEAEQLRRAHDPDGAIVHFRRAARWYAPLSPYHERALRQLQDIARAAESAGDSERALSAWRAVRGSILATRSVYVPARASLALANQHIAALMARQPAPGMDAGKSVEQLQAEHLALLTPIPGPDVFWSCVLLLGFFCWVGAAFVFSLRAIDEQDRWVGREVRRWGSLIALGLGLFVLGMVLA